MSYDDDNDFESFVEDEFELDEDLLDDQHPEEFNAERPFEVNVVSKRSGLNSRRRRDTNNDEGVLTDSDNELELHGKGNRMKLSKKPPEVLLRQYQKKISDCLQQKRFDLAIEDLVRCTALSRIVYGDSHWKFAKSEADLAEAYWKHKAMAPQAQQHAEEARNIMLRVVQTGEAQEDRAHIYRTLLSVYVTLGEAYNAQQKFTDAELCYQKAEKILSEQKKLQRKSLSGDEQEMDQELKTSLRIAQGKLAANQGKAASAIAYFEEAIGLTQSEYGDDSIKLITLYQMVGRVEQGREGANHIKSIDAYLQAHSIANANYSEGTEELAETGYQLALAYTRAAAHDKDAETSAESYLNECLATYQSLHGPNHEKTLKCQDELSRLMIRTDRTDEAIGLLRSTLAAKRQTFGEYSQSLASTYKLLGSVHMSQGNMEKALKSMNKELSEAEQQYRALQQQHLHQLETALAEKDKQISDGKALFDQLKKDFKYNLRLIQERDEELQQCDVALAQLREQLNHQLNTVSELGIKLHEASEKCSKLEDEVASKETNFKKQLRSERSEFDRKFKEKLTEHSRDRLQWEAEKRTLDEQLKIAEEMRIKEKQDFQTQFDEQLNRQQNDWKVRVESLESELLAHQLRVTSLTTETEKLREDRTAKCHIVESSEAAQRRLENDLKQCKWELDDYRATCTRRIQDLESQIAFTEQSQKTLVEKYERKLVQSEHRLRETVEQHEKLSAGHNDRVSELNKAVRGVKESLSDKETEIARLQWKVEDLIKEKTKVVEKNALSTAKFEEQIKILEAKDNSPVMQEEIKHLKKNLEEAGTNLKARMADIEKYQTELVAANDQLLEADRQRARLELQCQKKCDQILRDQHEKSEKLISRLSQSKDRADATIKRLEKESTLQQQAIAGLKKDRDEAYETLRAHGLSIQIANSAAGEVSGGPEADSNVLRLQNENLKQVISQMRSEMETLATTNPSKSSVTSNDAQPGLYVTSLEEEIQHLKQQLRQQERTLSKSAYTTEDLVNAVKFGEDTALKEVVSSLNATIASLRSEKVALMAASRKQQVELDSCKSQIKQAQQAPKQMMVDLEQAKYELNSTTRKFETEVASLKQRVNELETQLDSSREESAEYHRNLLNANADLQAVSTELSTLKMSQARSGSVINYGAQELVIQNLQDENKRLRNMVTDKPEHGSKGGELQKALSQISQLNKEKIVLTELSNRLRSELAKAGVNVTKPAVPPSVPQKSAQVRYSVHNKLDELEKLQYQLMKAEIANPKSAGRKVTQPPPTKEGKPGRGKGRHQSTRLPMFVEQSSTSGSSFKAKGKPAVVHAPQVKRPQTARAPLPKGKPKSNVAWVNNSERNSYARKSMKDKENIEAGSISSEALNAEPHSIEECLGNSRDPGFTLDSMELGSSLQDVWKILDDQPSLSSTNPD